MPKEVVPIHGPDHCPGGPDPIPCLGGGPYAVILWDDGASIADDTPTTLASLTDFRKAYVSDPSLLAVNLTNGSIILDDVEGPGAGLLAGLWLATLKITWTGNFAAEFWGMINWTMGVAKVFDEVQGRVFYSKAQDAGAAMSLTEHCDGTSMVIVTTGGTGNNRVTGSLKQISGGSQDLEQVVLSVERLETYPAANGVFVP